MKKLFLIILCTVTLVQCSKEELVFTETENAEGAILNQNHNSKDTLGIDVNKDGISDLKITFFNQTQDPSGQGKTIFHIAYLNLNNMKADMIVKFDSAGNNDQSIAQKIGTVLDSNSAWMIAYNPSYASKIKTATIGGYGYTELFSKSSTYITDHFNKGEILIGLRYRLDVFKRDWYYGWALVDVNDNGIKIIRYSFNKKVNESIKVGDI